MVSKLKPNVILMDIRMPDLDGIQALEAIKAEKLETRVVMVTTYRSTAYLLRSLSAGAAGFVRKREIASQLLDAVDVVLAGRRYAPPDAPGPVSVPDKKTVIPTKTQKQT